MENTKAKKVLLVTLSILLVVSIGIIIYQYITFNKFKNVNTNTTSKEQEIEKTEIENKDNELVEKQKEFTVEDLVSETKKELEKKYGGTTYKYTLVMPQIKLDKTFANKINEEIKKFYDLSIETFESKPSNGSYKYSAKIQDKILTITITNSHSDFHATGSSEGALERVYKYDYINDKRVYSKVSDLIDDFEFMVNPISYKDYELDMVLPQFKVLTKETQQINDKINEIYLKYLDAYRAEEDSTLNSKNTKISYKANMDDKSGILTLDITIEDTNSANKKLGVQNIIYKYDYVNDKVVD